MHVMSFLHDLLAPVMHLKRLRTFSLLISGVLTDKKLSVTQLGRSIQNNIQEKSNIKRSDRFLSNAHVQKERVLVYKALVSKLILPHTRPWLIVDWSHIPNTTCYALRAAFVGKGRALTIYEEVHPQACENHPKVHERFLQQLKALLPQSCRPILITDAGFCNPWFNAVTQLGWDYIGRVRGKKLLRLDSKGTWCRYHALAHLGTSKAQYLGEGLLAKSHPMATHFYLMKQPKKYRCRLNKLKKKSHYKKDLEQAKAANEPWLLVSSLRQNAEAMMDKYATRMTIEEGFRDLKSSQFGLSFEKAYSYKLERIQVLLMIAMVASVLAYLMGWSAETQNWHYSFQANTSKHRRVLSLFYLGCRLYKKQIAIPYQWLSQALEELAMSLERLEEVSI